MKCGDFSENPKGLTFTAPWKVCVIAFNLLIFLLREFSIVFKLKVKQPWACVGEQLQIMEWRMSKMVCNLLCGEPPVRGGISGSFGAWSMNAETTYVENTKATYLPKATIKKCLQLIPTSRLTEKLAAGALKVAAMNGV